MINSFRSAALSATLGLGSAFFVAPAIGQEQPGIDGLHLGIGLGQDVGGIIGARATYWAAPWLSGFVGGGWAVVGAAYNAGMELRLPTKSRTSPFLVAMYGYNGVIHIRGKETLDDIYYGPTVGAGLMLQQRFAGNYWRFSINIPFRSQEMMDDWEAIKARPDIEVVSDLVPITFGVGYHFSL
ncbi:MAG: hypothetical protein JNL43_13705 [Flavobacteriales bacterium]|nr:hypothetical protein [Flavobacteriales bacterium]